MGQIRLNENQKKAVEYNDGDLLIIAGAGTGKTAVITQRVLHIIKKEWAKPSEILALTYTEKAAEEMQVRIDEQMEYGYDEPVVSTFHSFCDKILREDGYNIGLDSGYSLMSKGQSYIFLRRHFYELGFETLLPNGSPTNFINDFRDHVGRLQDEDVSPEDYLQYAEGLKDKEEQVKALELAKAYKKYTELKIENSRLDFGDLILLTIRLFRERKNVLEKYRKRFKYILVDEFQDTNYTQNVLINTIKGMSEEERKDGPVLTVVGDDDQAIYKFRGAAISNILQFKERYPEAQEVVLTENYRSRQEILDSAHALIKHNDPYRLEITEKIDKRLIAKGAFEPDSDVVNLVVAKNELDEAERVVEEILELTGYGELIKQREDKTSQTFDKEGQSTFLDSQPAGKDAKYKFSDIAILLRANNHAEVFIQALRSKGVRYKVGGSRGLYYREEIKNLICFLRVLVDYSDEKSMYRLLTMPIWGLSPREYVDLVQIAREKKETVLEALEKEWKIKLGSDDLDADDFKSIDSKLIEKILSPQSIAGIGTLLMLLDSSIKKLKDGRQITEILYDFVMQSSYIESFVNENSPESLFAITNIDKFFQLVKNYEKDNPDSNIYEYVEYLNYSIQAGETPLVDQGDLDELDAVSIMTVHGSKGLEFPVVFVVNVVVDRFPVRNRSDVIPIPEELIKEVGVEGLSDREANIQEERRLFYVASTRAKERLYLTGAQYYGDAKRRKKPSIFLQEVLNRNVDSEFQEEIGIENFTDDFIHLSKNVDMGNSIIPQKDMKDLIKKFSYSHLGLYERCPRKYEYAYVLRIPTKGNAATSFGTTVHNTLKDFYALLMRSREGLEGIVEVPTLEVLLDLYEKNWVSAGYDSKKHEELRKMEGKVLMKTYYKNFFSKEENPLKLEESFNWNLGDTAFKGQIDRIDLVGVKDGVQEVVIVDYKTGKEKKPADIKKDFQLPLYALVAEMKFGLKVVGAKYIFVEAGSVVEVDVSEKRREEAKEKLLETLESIKNGDFTPKPQAFTCRFCDFNSICEYAEL